MFFGANLKYGLVTCVRVSIETNAAAIGRKILKIQLVHVAGLEISTNKHFWFQNWNKPILIQEKKCEICFALPQ